MADPHINPHLSIDEDNKTRDNKLEDSKPPIPKTQALDTTLARLITIDKDFTEVHAVQTISQIIVSASFPNPTKTSAARRQPFTNAHRSYGLTSLISAAVLTKFTACLESYVKPTLS